MVDRDNWEISPSIPKITKTKSRGELKSWEGRSPDARNKKPELEEKEGRGLWMECLPGVWVVTMHWQGVQASRSLDAGGEAELPVIRTAHQ